MLRCAKENSIIKGLKHDRKSKICFRFKSTVKENSFVQVQELYAHNLYSFARHKYNFTNAYLQMIFTYFKKKKQDWEALQSHWQCKKFFFKKVAHMVTLIPAPMSE